MGAGRQIEFASELGYSAIRLEGIEEHLTPVLLIKKPNAIAQSSSQPSPPPAPNRHPEAAAEPLAPIEVFISYSHKDDDLKDAFLTHLSNLKRQKKINHRLAGSGDRSWGRMGDPNQTETGVRRHHLVAD